MSIEELKIKKELESIENIENSSIELKTKEESANELKNGNEIFATTVDRWTEETNPLLDSYIGKVVSVFKRDVNTEVVVETTTIQKNCYVAVIRRNA